MAQQYNPMPPQSNGQQTMRNEADELGHDRPTQPLYITPSPNEAPLYQATQGGMNSNANTHDKSNNAWTMTQNPINIQQQQLDEDNGAAREQPSTATGRAVDYQSTYPFGQLITPLIKNAPRPVYTVTKAKPMASARPLSPSPSHGGKVYAQTVYPSTGYQRKPPSRAEIDKLRGRGAIRDRFTPSEAVASHQIKANNHNHHHPHNHAPMYAATGKAPAASNLVNTYVPPKDLYSFPPNNVDYPLPSQANKLALPTSVVNSYSPPASGYSLAAAASSNDNGYKYPGPLNLGYLPSLNGNDNGNGGDTKDQKDNANDGDADNGGGGGGGDDGGGDMDDTIGVLPASAMGNDNSPGDAMDMSGMDQMPMKDVHDDHSYDTEKEYPTPPPEWLKAHPEALNDHPPHDGGDAMPQDGGDTMPQDGGVAMPATDDHDHHSDHDYLHADHDDHAHDHDHDHDHDHHHHHPDIILDSDSYPYYHHSFPSFPHYPHYPEIIYDDHHDHHHHVEPPPTTTTEPPPPEPPPEPRVKKYSYFYIGRKLWYIPLYFTVWFSFYVLWLILKSIARHKVNLPNHYVARRSVDNNYNLSKTHRDVINQLTLSVMEKIERFKNTHLS
ncbi:uncharacterized protein LOC106088175 [Stomoxys calcitrans]|uniref:uncharacterized protein LOC106088175 n=1 Tax=Stomoxys calcitrans TaxID=35570 RepID=UPI0027E3353A|nr:uncharacterized protein LOC106088175 [Stomoxys calcitrans]